MEMITLLLEKNAAIIGRCLFLFLFFPLLRLAGFILYKTFNKRLSEQAVMLLRKGVVYIGSSVVFLLLLQQLGFKLGTLLGAAGVAGVAIGFAAQTSLSNLISGLFLIWEAPFKVGDVLHSGTDHGIVYSIDLLSIQLRTFNNQLVRIPNEILIKTSFTNVTRFPIRRMDIPISVAYKEDIPRVMEILADVANRNPYCLDEPAAVIIFQQFGDSALEFLFAPWFAKSDYVALRNSLMQEVKKRFDEEGIEIPFPHRTLYAGSESQPFEVHIKSTDSRQEKDVR